MSDNLGALTPAGWIHEGEWHEFPPTPRWGELADKDLDPFGTLTVKESA